MSENKKTPPKVPPQRIPRKPETSYAAQQYSPRPPTPPAAPKNTNTLALISLIVGIIGILTLLLSLCTWCLGMVPLLLCAAAAVSGYLAKKQIDESGGLQSGRKMAIAGMIVGAAGFVLALVVTGISFAYSGFTALQDIL